jgi:beta-glucosidase
MNTFRSVLLILTILFVNPVFSQESKSFDKEVETLLNKMTLEEKVGQMIQYSSFWDVTGPAPSDGFAKIKMEQLKNGMVGSMLNVRGAENIRKWQEMAVNNSRLGIPMIFGLDVIHGHQTVMPVPLAEAASWDLKEIENSSRLSAIEASAVGVNWTFAPMIDVSRDARWGRVMEGGGEDPFLVSRIAEARVKGYQGEDLAADNTIAACAKHLAAYGFSEAGKEYNTVDIGTVVLHNIVLPPFKAAADAGVKTMMNAFNILNGVPATGDPFLQLDIVKGKWGFEGFIVSDWASASQMQQHGFASDLKHAAELAANAGSDMDMESYAYARYLTELVEEGKVPMHVIDDAVKRILKVKFELGLFDDPYKYCDETKEKELLYHPDHLKAAQRMAEKSIVLLKNENDLLPLSKKQKKIAVIGPLADEKNSPLGSWRFGSIDSSAVSVLEGLDAIGVEYDFERGPEFIKGDAHFVFELDINENDRTGIEEAVNLAKESELVILVLGEHGFQSGEARSRTNIGLPGLQQELLEAVYEVNKNIVLVLMSGRPLTISWADENIPAILQTWQLGSMAGHAITSVLFGDYNPSGKLPISFPRNVGQIPVYYNHYNTGRPSNAEKNVFWSHYSDVENSPLYPFGYGLSYTTFEYKSIKVKEVEEGQLKVSVEVINSGERAGEEVVQVYIRDLVAKVVRPVKELKGFQKILLQPGESKTVDFMLTKKELGFYDAEGQYIFEPGDFHIMAGPDSQKLMVKPIKLNW